MRRIDKQDSQKNIMKGGDPIVNNKTKSPILIAILFTFFILAGLPQISFSVDKTAG